MTPGFLIDALPFVDPGQSYATAATRVCGAADQADANVRNLLARLHAGALPATARPHSGFACGLFSQLTRPAASWSNAATKASQSSASA
jgi:hypothetical protein